MKLYKTLLFMAGMALMTTSCDSFLDEMPDNRATINKEDDIKALVTTAYASVSPCLINELMSDNIDDYGENNPYTDRFYDHVYHWENADEENNESPESIWDNQFAAIAAANQALMSIQDLGGAKTTSMQEIKAEALLCRAYAYFTLINTFCKSYDAQTAGTDLGLPYTEEPETTLDPKYKRETVAQNYQKIERDILEALPIMGDAHLTVPKYHFNTEAAYAFACRFYLYYQKWDEAVKYANLCIGNQPGTWLRNWAGMAKMSQTSYQAITNEYVNADINCNLLLMTSISNTGYIFNNLTSEYARYTHGAYLASNEDGNAKNIWGSARLYMPMQSVNQANVNKTVFWKLPALFEYVDPVAKIGYRRTINVAFSADECLLNRAEAYIMLKEYDKAAADLTTWMQNFVNTKITLTPASITTFYKPIAYSYDKTDDDALGIESTIKKHLHPSFTIDEEGSTQECMLQCVLGFRRIETLEQGMRWYDVNRYGIEIIRRVMNANGAPYKKVDVLKVDDPRRVVQIPLKVRNAGFEPNPR